MCVFNTNTKITSFEYDIIFTGGENICSKNCLGNGTCKSSICKCQAAFGGESCEVGISELQTNKELQIIIEPGSYKFFKVAKKNVLDSAALNFKLSSLSLKCYLVKDSSPNLPSSSNTLKLFPLESKGEEGVGFIPENEVPGFDGSEYEFLVLCKYPYYLYFKLCLMIMGLQSKPRLILCRRRAQPQKLFE